MATASPKPCSHPGCSALVYDGSGGCARHPRPVWEKRPTSVKRVTGRKLQRMRDQLFREQPLCVECLKHGRVRAATQRDHIKPLHQFEGSADDPDHPDNIQALCDECHDAKTQAEALEARRGGSKVQGA